MEKHVRRYAIAFILIFIFTLAWGENAVVAADTASGRLTKPTPFRNHHSTIPIELSSWFQALFNNSLSPVLAACTIAPPAVKIMPLGDSITKGVYGSGYPETRQDAEIGGYRLPLYVSLRNSGYNVDFVGSEQAGNAYPNFDVDHEGHPGYRDSRVASNVYNWLVAEPAEIILLHIGTNSLNSNPADVEDILDEIKRYKQDNPGTSITTVVARIIDRIPRDPTTTAFNDNVVAMINGRDDQNTIVVVDMENGAGIVYDFSHNGGDMADDLHPYATGYEKMADQWLATIDGLDLTSCFLPPKIHSNPITQVTVGHTYNYPVVASGNPALDYELITYPEGMSINSTSGLITWAPGVTGSFNVTVQVGNGVSPAARQSFTLQVVEPGLSITMTPPVQQVNKNGTANFTVAITNSGTVTLSDISVSAPNAPDCNRTGLGSLDPGNSITPYACSLGAVTADRNVIATVAAKDPVNATVVGTSNLALVDVLPTITLVQQNPADVTHPAPGGPVDFTLKVTNTSSEAVTLTSLWNSTMGELTDPGNARVSTTTCNADTAVAAGNSYTCEVTATFTGNWGTTYEVFIEATAEDDEGNVVTDDAGGTKVSIIEPPVKYIYLPSVQKNP